MSVIELNNLEKNFEIRQDVIVEALKGVNLKVEKGEFLAIMGPSGSGKSTLLHILGLLDKHYKGVYKLNGQDTKNLTSDKMAELRNTEIGFIFQRFNLLPRTSVINNILLPTLYNGQSTDLERAFELINKLGLKDHIEHKSNELSGGQVQRVAIARALIKNPSFLLADEPTGNIDSKTAQEIMRIFQTINKEGTTIILITHDKEVASYASRRVLLKDGKFINE